MTLDEFFEIYQAYIPLPLSPQFECRLYNLERQEEARETAGQD